MVVRQGEDDPVDRTLRALADATRRDILHRVCGAELSVSRLAENYPMSLTAVQKHVAILQRAGLVQKERRGREQIVRAVPGALAPAGQALDDLAAVWRGRIDRMSTLLTDTSRPDPLEKETNE